MQAAPRKLASQLGIDSRAGELRDLRLHDLRRTFRTGLSRLGVDTETAELALGHARSDLEARYNKDAATGELRKAFEAWANHLERAVSPTAEGVFA